MRSRDKDGARPSRLLRRLLGGVLLLVALLLVTCGSEEETGLRLLIQAEGLDAPADFDALALKVSSEHFASYERPYDLLHGELAGQRDPLHDNRIIFPLDLLILADAPGGTEIAIEITGYLCGDGETVRQEALGWDALKTCVTDAARRVATSGPVHPRIKLVKDRVREVTVTLRRFEGSCEDADEDGFGVGLACAGEDCDDSDPAINPSADEDCADEIDNDCDGTTNEDCGCSASDPPRSCFTGPPSACPVLGCAGRCKLGEQRCEDGAWSVTCYGEVLPATEICDGQDNDCNRQTDEGDAHQLCADRLPPNAEPVCAEGICRIDHCLDGFIDANNDYSDGCEAEASCSGQGECEAGATGTEERECDRCGKETRTRSCSDVCSWGAWSDWSGCAGQGECEAGSSGSEERDCTRCGKETRTRTCDDTCAWGAFSDWSGCAGQGECEDGETQTDDCGNCNTGTRSRTCTASCSWGSYTACSGAAPCAAGETETDTGCSDCGTGSRTRTCGSDCQWDDWGACSACSWEEGHNWRSCTGDQCTTASCWQYCSSQCAWFPCQNRP